MTQIENNPPPPRPWPKPLRDAAGKVVSGSPTLNPNGRPRGDTVLKDSIAAVDQLARATSPLALATVIELMQVSDGKTKLAAALAILDRGIGKAGDKVSEPINLPADATATEKADAITYAIMQGRLSVSTANGILSAMASAAKIRETEELAARIAKLENMQ